MMHSYKQKLAASVALLLAVWLPLGSAAAAQSFTFAYQTGADPTKVPQAQGDYEKATGWHIQWRRFDSGPSVMAALASGAVQMADLGSGPLAAAVSRELPITTFLIVNQLGSAEALVVSNKSGITQPDQLKGKTIATPFVSTSHFSLLGALKHWGLKRSEVNVVNMSPAAITAAYRRGDIDGAYVWAPALNQLKQSGRVLTDSDQVARWGAPTFEAWVVRNDFARQHPEVVSAMAGVSLKYFAEYNHDPARWGPHSSEAGEIARLIGVQPGEVPELLAGAHYPNREQQLSTAFLGGDTALQLKNTATFIYHLGTLPGVLSDYSPFVSTHYIQALPNAQTPPAHAARQASFPTRTSHHE